MGPGRKEEPPGVVGASAAQDESDFSAADSSLRRDVNELALQHLDLVDVIARHVSRAIEGAVEFEELVAAGREGLLSAARRFDPKRGLPFRAFAGFRVEGAIVDAVRKSSPLPRRLHERLAMLEATREQNEGSTVVTRPSGAYSQRQAPEVELDEHLAAMATAAMVTRERDSVAEDAVDERPLANPERAYAAAELGALVKRAVSELDEYQARVIELYYFEGKSFEAAAEALKISKPWASRLHARGIELLTKRLRGTEDI